jgi:DNA-directed RNA polymerase subunit M/transcription elongation factor TFIIS
MCMRFCDKCGSRMKISKKSYVCLKCGNTFHAETDFIEVTKVRPPESKPIYVMEASRKDTPIISRICSKCGNQQAFQWSSTIAGEHSGVKQERTVEHYRCTECQHKWAETK